MELPSPTWPPTPTATASGGLGKVNTVDVNYSFTDSLLLYTVVIQKATAWVPALPYYGDSPGGVRMIGVRIAVDATKTLESGLRLTRLPSWRNFYVVGDNGIWQQCESLIYYEVDQVHRERILAAIGGDVDFKLDETSGGGEGWIVCQTLPGKDAQFGATYGIFFQASALDATSDAPHGTPGTSFLVEIKP